uniref:Uncharacterized protein n=1 Tax=Romanomermis culicivorax TaxID=13658 RepID=A0A915IPN7_ROMCU
MKQHEFSSLLCGDNSSRAASASGSVSPSNDSSCSSTSRPDQQNGYRIIRDDEKMAADRGYKLSTSESDDSRSDGSNSSSSSDDDSISLTASLLRRKCAGSAPASLDLYGLNRFADVISAAGDSNVHDENSTKQTLCREIDEKMQTHCSSQHEIPVDNQFNEHAHAHYANVTSVAPPSATTWYSPPPPRPQISNNPSQSPMMFINPWYSSGHFVPNYVNPTPMMATAPLPLYFHPPPPVMMFYTPTVLTTPMPYSTMTTLPPVVPPPQHRTNLDGGDWCHMYGPKQDRMQEKAMDSSRNATTISRIPIYRNNDAVEIPITRLSYNK